MMCPGGRIAEVETRKTLNNFEGTGMQEKDKKRDSDFLRGWEAGIVEEDFYQCIG